MTENELIEIVYEVAEDEDIAHAIVKSYVLVNKYKELGDLDSFVDWVRNY